MRWKCLLLGESCSLLALLVSLLYVLLILQYIIHLIWFLFYFIIVVYSLSSCSVKGMIKWLDWIHVSRTWPWQRGASLFLLRTLLHSVYVLCYSRLQIRLQVIWGGRLHRQLFKLNRFPGTPPAVYWALLLFQVYSLLCLIVLSVFTESSFPLLHNEKDGDKKPKPLSVVVTERVCGHVKTCCKIKRRERQKSVCACKCLCVFEGLN